jgi:hypothetical protein
VGDQTTIGNDRDLGRRRRRARRRPGGQAEDSVGTVLGFGRIVPASASTVVVDVVGNMGVEVNERALRTGVHVPVEGGVAADQQNR